VLGCEADAKHLPGAGFKPLSSCVHHHSSLSSFLAYPWALVKLGVC
jgi:hypothetical protein